MRTGENSERKGKKRKKKASSASTHPALKFTSCESHCINSTVLLYSYEKVMLVMLAGHVV
jgi:hypothetical protein